jgi:hypothetical protein
LYDSVFSPLALFKVICNQYIVDRFNVTDLEARKGQFVNGNQSGRKRIDRGIIVPRDVVAAFGRRTAPKNRTDKDFLPRLCTGLDFFDKDLVCRSEKIVRERQVGSNHTAAVGFGYIFGLTFEVQVLKSQQELLDSM